MNLKNLGAALGVAALTVVATATSASAAIITLSPGGTQYQQGAQNPCIFFNSPCQPGIQPGSVGIPNGNPTSWDLTSTYTGSQLLPFLNGGSLVLGLDVNQTNANSPQTLVNFQQIVNGVVTASIAAPTLVPVLQNGTGFADYLLTGFTSFNAGDTVAFRFVFDNANDGAENVFVISGQPNTPVPEPATMLLLGTGLLVAARARRKNA